MQQVIILLWVLEVVVGASLVATGVVEDRKEVVVVSEVKTGVEEEDATEDDDNVRVVVGTVVKPTDTVDDTTVDEMTVEEDIIWVVDVTGSGVEELEDVDDMLTTTVVDDEGGWVEDMLAVDVLMCVSVWVEITVDVEEETENVVEWIGTVVEPGWIVDEMIVVDVVVDGGSTTWTFLDIDLLRGYWSGYLLWARQVIEVIWSKALLVLS